MRPKFLPFIHSFSVQVIRRRVAIGLLSFDVRSPCLLTNNKFIETFPFFQLKLIYKQKEKEERKDIYSNCFSSSAFLFVVAAARDDDAGGGGDSGSCANISLFFLYP